MASAKTATLGLLKVKIFRNKGYGITNKMLSLDSYYIVNVVMRSKFDNYSVSMREVIINSVL